MIHNNCRHDEMTKSEKGYKTTSKDDCKTYPVKKKDIVVIGVARTKKDDHWYKRDLMIEHF